MDNLDMVKIKTKFTPFFEFLYFYIKIKIKYLTLDLRAKRNSFQ